MTVRGKGGRPRKWRSDADRVRAYRARQRGEHEPATFETALIERDELALALERGRQLQADLADAAETIAELDTALHADLEALRSENDRLHSQRVATPRQEPAGPNRAARRQAARRDRHPGH